MQVPTQTKSLKLGPVSQVNIQAHPLSAESEFMGMRADALEIADKFKLPVVLTLADGKAFTFTPYRKS